MPNRLEAIGFQDIAGVETLLSVLNTLTECAIRTDPSKIVCKPFEECAIVISLGTNGQPKHIEISLGGIPQTCLPYKFDHYNEETLVSAFTCIDGKPIAPIWFWTTTETLASNAEMGKIFLCEIQGFARTFEEVETDINDLWVNAHDSEGNLEFQGVVLSVKEDTNIITKNIVTLCRIYLPGIVIPVCMQGRGNIEPGTTIRGTGIFYGHLYPT